MADLRARLYETLLNMTTQLLATKSLDERIMLALDTITAEFGYPHAAFALLDERNGVLRVRRASGFRDNSAVERIEMPLESAALGVSVIHEGNPVWITGEGDEYSPFLGHLATDTDILALPLFGARWPLKNPEGDYSGRSSSEHKYWQPKAVCIGALYVGADRCGEDATTFDLLLRCAEQIGVTIAAAIQTEGMTAIIDKLQRERQWVESIMKSVADPIVLTNLDNEILLQNRRAEDLFSGSQNASEGKRRALEMNDLLFSAYLSSAAVSSTEIIGRDLTLVDPIEGSEIHFEVISTLALNDQGERIGMVSIFRDVSDLRKANEELARNYIRLQQAEADARRERDHLNLIIENVGHPVVVTDANGDFILFNRRAERLFQQEQTASERDQMFPQEEDPAIARALVAVRANSIKLTSFISGLDRGSQRAEIELLDPESGETLPMEITSVEVLDPKGQVNAVVSMLHDLSEIRELERRRVEQKLFESEKLAALGTLAASIAHEVNNPLEAIKNALFLLQSGKDDPANVRFLKIATKETERVSHIIHQMLGFARRSGGVEWVNVNQLIEETLELVESKLQHSGIKVETGLDSTLPVVHAYPDQLRQVILNLILNAQQAIGRRGRIRIATSRYDPATPPSILIEISDTGCGLSEEDVAQIFKPFYSMRKDGTGLGLWVTENIVRRHGGRIDVKSSKGKGATFQIILPVDSPALMSAAKE